MSKKLFVVSGPSGTGLGEVVSAIFRQRDDVCAVTPVTARKRKAGEQDGVGFFFFDLEQWNAKKETGDLLETTEFAGNDYGTSREQVEKALTAGKHVLLNLSVERAAQIKTNMPQAVCVYMEPSDPVLRERIGKISRNALEASVRLETAQKQRSLSGFCDARICTDDLDAAARELSALMDR